MAKLVSKVYGDALFEAAREAGRMDDMYEEVLKLQKLLQANEELQKMMENPKVIREIRKMSLKPSSAVGFPMRSWN